MDYVLIKDFHNLFRWIIVLSGCWALMRVWSGLLTKAAWGKQDRIAGLVFSSALNVQFLLGIALIAVSPIMRSVMMSKNFGAAMKDGTMRFFLIEHPTMMLIAVIVAQIGFSISKRAPDDEKKFKKAAIFYTISMVLILLAIPWPFLKYGRPLWPFVGLT